jgi:threonine/homoserine/homoserine lactone efflux protein
MTEGTLTMTASSIIAFWAVAALLIVAPGADWAFTLGATLRGNAVASAVGGLVTGYVIMTAAGAAGIGALVAGSSPALTTITFVGGAYLVWLGVGTLRRPSSPVAEIGAPNRTNRHTYIEGIGVSGLNPKGLLIFVAVLPRFTSPHSSWPLAAQMVVLGLAFTLTCAVFYAVLGSFATAVLMARPAVARIVSRLSGIGMLAIGTLLGADWLLH